MISKLIKALKSSIQVIALGSVFVGAIYYVNERAIDNAVISDAEIASVTSAQYFERNLPGIFDVIDGKPLSDEGKNFVKLALQGLDVERYRLYDKTGKLLIDSYLLDGSGFSSRAIGNTSDHALSLTKNSTRPVTRFAVEKNGRDQVIVETFVPILRFGTRVGVSEIYMNQTEKMSQFRNDFTTSTLIVILLAALAFAMPAVAFLMRTRQKEEVDETLRFMANNDALTKLPNRAWFMQEFNRSLDLAINKGEQVLLHFVDLDWFKEVNDLHGHDAGDAMLKAVAGRLRSIMRTGDLVGRFGGDEFVVAQFGFTTNEQIQSATNRLTSAFIEPFGFNGKQFKASASIGSAIGPQHGRTTDDLIKSADTAVYDVKARGRNSQAYYDRSLDEAKRSRNTIERRLQEAIDKKLFNLNYQPLYSFATGEIKGFEALLRLSDENGKAISPAVFVPIAEDTGLINDIGNWVLMEACKTAAGWPTQLQISVNLSVIQFRRRSVNAAVRDALAASGLHPSRLQLEITESLLLQDSESVMEQLQELKQQGVAIVMDDFGTGYSSLGYMMKFPFDRIKIDRSFINGLADDNAQARSIVETIITLGHVLKMNVTAEGVETNDQAEMLRKLRCDDAQGYLYGKPVPTSEIAPIIMRNFATQMLPAAETQTDKKQSS
jgi:diguanylate cyclase (GGDEF)-like protein